MDFERIDINQCPPGEGNIGPNHFADTARCKTETTEVCVNLTLQKIKKKLTQILFSSVSHWTVGAFEEADINADASHSIAYRVTSGSPFSARYWRGLPMSSIITVLIA